MRNRKSLFYKGEMTVKNMPSLIGNILFKDFKVYFAQHTRGQK